MHPVAPRSVAAMSDTLPRYHVLTSTCDGVPWEGDITAHDVRDAADQALAAYVGEEPHRITHLLVRRLPDDCP